MGNTYGVAIIGAGWVAGEYVKAFRDHPQTNLIGVYNRTPGKASALLRVPWRRCQEYASIDDLFDDDRVQIIASCTPPDVRPEHVIRAAESGRHVVIEKPVALTPEGVARSVTRSPRPASSRSRRSYCAGTPNSRPSANSSTTAWLATWSTPRPTTGIRSARHIPATTGSWQGDRGERLRRRRLPRRRRHPLAGR
jgi:hypothetical protein